MSSVRVGGVWKDISEMGARVSGTWRDIDQGYVRVGGVWKNIFEAFTYAWETGSYGDCSVTCGGGTQARPVVCKRSDDVTVSDSLCTETKPATSQDCNTQACQVCYYVKGTYHWGGEGCGGAALNIIWNGSTKASNVGTATSKTVSGYLYTRSTKKIDSQVMGPCGAQPLISIFFRVCRQPV